MVVGSWMRYDWFGCKHSPFTVWKADLEQSSVQVSRMLGGLVVNESPLARSDEIARSIEIELFNYSWNTDTDSI